MWRLDSSSSLKKSHVALKNLIDITLVPRVRYKTTYILYFVSYISLICLIDILPCYLYFTDMIIICDILLLYYILLMLLLFLMLL